MIFVANVIGLMMMGALTADYVTIDSPLTITASGSEFVVQDFLDSILPGILPLAAVFLIYWYMVRKGQKFTRILLAVIAISLIGGITGIL